ncbi:hypothetical protein TrRE_jg9039 [Triparma retinervis]|uniref:Pseudouridine synthase RsuA/RluA-like domain-containing protein n=1 Tax=Triparma retinervis TaxID=2557542 RepID=A0A9W7DLI7_9STRA|nr:hypothetical protein TrRE_jg9039 [Triparma retinervis]
MVLDPPTYPSLSAARKACRKGNVILIRTSQDNSTSIRGRAGDRVHPLDTVHIQTRLSNSFYPSLTYAKPAFDLPVIYEDDEIAIVDKPAGIVTYSHRKGGHGRMTVRAALPYCLKPPASNSTRQILRRPSPVHRLDKATSGLMVIAKTKGAMVDLSKSFAERSISKTYTAILNGLPDDEGLADNEGFALIDQPVVGKEAITRWKPLQYSKSLKANSGILTLVEFLPKTGRYHQLRDHSANALSCPIVGDTEHDGGTESALCFRDNGMYLCSNKVTLPHPTLSSLPSPPPPPGAPFSFHRSDDGRILLSAALPSLPEKYQKLMSREEKRVGKHSSSQG